MFELETSKCVHTAMDHLLEDGLLSRVQNNLAESRQLRNIHGAWWFNVLILVALGALCYFFLVAQYHSTKTVIEPVNIPKTELIWNNSIRNAIEY